MATVVLQSDTSWKNSASAVDPHVCLAWVDACGAMHSVVPLLSVKFEKISSGNVYTSAICLFY